MGGLRRERPGVKWAYEMGRAQLQLTLHVFHYQFASLALFIVSHLHTSSIIPHAVNLLCSNHTPLAICHDLPTDSFSLSRDPFPIHTMAMRLGPSSLWRSLQHQGAPTLHDRIPIRPIATVSHEPSKSFKVILSNFLYFPFAL